MHHHNTFGHGGEHVVSLFFSEIFLNINAFKNLSNFSKKLRNVLGSTRHTTTEIFNK